MNIIQVSYAADASDCKIVNHEKWRRLTEAPKDGSEILHSAKPTTKKSIEGASSIVWYSDQTGSLKVCIPGSAELNCGERVFTFIKNGSAWNEESLFEVIECT